MELLASIHVVTRVCAVTIRSQGYGSSIHDAVTFNVECEGMPWSLCVYGEIGIINHKVEL